MKRTGIHKPTVEDTIEMSGIEILHPGGSLLTNRTAQVANLHPGMKILDVSSGRGTLAIECEKEFGVKVIGLDISEEMVRTATERAKQAGIAAQVSFRQLWWPRPFKRLNRGVQNTDSSSPTYHQVQIWELQWESHVTICTTFWGPYRDVRPRPGHEKQPLYLLGS